MLQLLHEPRTDRHHHRHPRDHHPGDRDPPAHLIPTAPAAPTPDVRRAAWRAVTGFGVVSLLGDLVYEGARSATGPLLASLGATALVAGLVTGAGEAAALVLRLGFGRLADRTRRYWSLTIAGYVLTAVSVPLLALSPFVGGAGVVLASTLVIAERTGKAVRSPAKSALLAEAAGPVGLGRGLGVHKALDQVGAFVGPLVVAGATAATGVLWPGFAVLVVPGGALVVLLLVLRRRTGPGPSLPPSPGAAAPGVADPERLPPSFWWFAFAAGAATAGLVTFGVISFHLTREAVVPVAVVPVVYAVGMATAAVAALATGWLYERLRWRSLVVLPFLVAGVPLLAFSDHAWVVVAGVALWGAAVGVQDSTVKALVADLVVPSRRATAYGVFAAVQGVAAMAGGATAGALYERSVPLLALVVVLTQAAALVVLLVGVGRTHPTRHR